MSLRLRLCVAGLVTALGLTGAARAEESQKVIHVYSAAEEHLVRPLMEMFTQESGIQVRLTTVDRAAMSARLALEGADTQADAVITADVANLYPLQVQGLLQPVESDVIKANIPEMLRQKDGLWTAVAVRARTFFIAKDRVAADALKFYEDIEDPQWKGRLLVRSSTNPYNQSLLADLSYRLGDEEATKWAKGVVNAMARKPEGGDRDQLRAVASGVGDVALSNTYYYGMLLASDDPSDREAAAKLQPVFVGTKDGKGTHVNIRGVAMVKASDKKDEVKQFFEFLTQEKAQQFFTATNKEYPANPSVAADPVLESWGFKPAPSVPLEVVGERNSKAMEIFAEAGWE
jgi:iron(III) transport system substrate-binding protein